jgi:glycosyltransferase involved in cell wall biosynthesis
VRLGLVLYGSLDAVTGGFIYDRMLVEYLEGQGDRVEVISLPWYGYGRGLAANLDDGVLERLSRGRFDLLVQDELAHPSLFWLNRRLKRQAAYPIVALVHHLRSSEARPAWQNYLYRKVERLYLNSVDGFIFNSRTTREVVESLIGPGRPGVVAYPGGDRLPGGLTPEQIQSRAAAPGPCTIIFVGALIRRKELRTLITALAALTRRDWRLWVVGSTEADPDYAAAIQRQIAEAGLCGQVSLEGVLSPEALAGRLARSHLLAVPSSYEGFGITYLEGMAFGLPALASTAGAAKEIISHGENGFLVPPGDAAALSGCLGLLMENRDQLLAMSLKARESFSRHPTWAETGAKIYRFLHNFGA